MKKLTYIAFLHLFTGTILHAQTKVAGYAFGKPGTADYEHIEFWTKDGKRAAVTYAYGKDHKAVELLYAGTVQIKGNPCFKVGFPNHYILFIIPNGVHLQVRDATGKYNKQFTWEYEGPVNGIGTFCDVCAENDEDAMKLIRTCFLK